LQGVLLGPDPACHPLVPPLPANLPLLLKLSMSNNYTTGKISDKIKWLQGPSVYGCV